MTYHPDQTPIHWSASAYPKSGCLHPLPILITASTLALPLLLYFALPFSALPSVFLDQPSLTSQAYVLLVVLSAMLIILKSYSIELFLMIGQYDAVQQQVKKHEAIVKGKLKSPEKLVLGMRVIMQKNRKISLERKDLQTKVIQARKLKIKISEVLNIKIKYSNHLLPKNIVRSVSSLQAIKKQEKLFAQTGYTNRKSQTNTVRKLLSAKKAENDKSRSFSMKSLHKKEDDEGMINLFQNFTYQELLRIQQNEGYYLMKEELISIFRKYMIRKRLNNKDFSYENFIIKNNQSQYLRFQEDGNFDKKSFILNSLGINEVRTQQNQGHILTNPIEYTRSSLQPLASRSLSTLKQSKKSLFSLLKDKQLNNKEKLLQQNYNKILNLKIDRNYFDGLAAQKRAVRQETAFKHILQKNKLDLEKSKACRQRIKTVREEIGRSVELAQQVRAQLLKRRTKIKKR